jgi:hypothetical protein
MHSSAIKGLGDRMNQEKDEILRLVNRLFDGIHSEADLELLQHLLRTSESARQSYLDWTTAHVLLERQFAPNLVCVPSGIHNNELSTDGMSDVQASAIPNGSSRIPTIYAVTGVACVLVSVLVVALGMGWFRNRSALEYTVANEANVETRSPFLLGTLLLAPDCEWQGRARKNGETLTNERLVLISGTAILRLDGGAEIGLKGPAALELISGRQAKLSYGEVVVRIEKDEEEGVGFLLLTPNCTVTDLGTEFQAKVRSDGEMEVHVNEGQVLLKSTSLQIDELVSSGKAVHVSAVNSNAILPLRNDISWTPSRFDVILEKARRSAAESLLAQESFDYVTGDHVTDSLQGGHGWRSAWRLRTQHELTPDTFAFDSRLADSSSQMRIAIGPNDSQQHSTFYRMTNGQQYRARELLHPIDLGTDGVHFVGMRVHRDAAATNAETKLDFLRLSFRSSTDYWGDHVYFGLRENRLPLIFTPTAKYRSVSGISTQGWMTWVGKIIHRATAPDEIYFRIYSASERLDAIEPANWHAIAPALQLNAKLDLLLLTNLGVTDQAIDEIRIGSTWESIAEMDEDFRSVRK